MIRLPCSRAPRVSIIIPATSSPSLLWACLNSVERFASKSIPFETIVVLNKAGEDRAAEVRANATGVNVLASPVNLGLAGAGNLGRHFARGEYLILLHDDAEIEPGWMEALVETADTHLEAGAVGGKVFFPDGRLQSAGMILWRSGIASPPWLYENPDPNVFDRVRIVDFCGTSALLVRAAAWDAVGGLDEQAYPVYYVDVSLSMALRSIGLAVLFQPEARIRHHTGKSTSALFHKFVNERNRGFFLQKWGDALKDHEARVEDSQDCLDRAMERAESFPERWRLRTGLSDRADRAPVERTPFDILKHELGHIQRSRAVQEEYLAHLTGRLKGAFAHRFLARLPRREKRG